MKNGETIMPAGGMGVRLPGTGAARGSPGPDLAGTSDAACLTVLQAIRWRDGRPWRAGRERRRREGRRGGLLGVDVGAHPASQIAPGRW